MAYKLGFLALLLVAGVPFLNSQQARPPRSYDDRPDWAKAAKKPTPNFGVPMTPQNPDNAGTKSVFVDGQNRVLDDPETGETGGSSEYSSTRQIDPRLTGEAEEQPGQRPSSRGEDLLREASEQLVTGPGFDKMPRSYGNYVDQIKESAAVMNETMTTDPETGFPVYMRNATDAIKDNDKLIDHDEFGPIGPGRRERLARLAGLSDAEAKSLWPWDDPKPFMMSDVNEAAQFMGGEGNTLPTKTRTQADVLANLLPGQNKERYESMMNTVLSEAETSFACYATLGLPLPLRVAKLEDAPVDGFVIFSPELLRVDPSKNNYKTRRLTFKWMVGEEEVYRATEDFTGFIHIPRPTSAPTTHMWLSCDQDVMAIQLFGIAPPGSIDQLRELLFNNVIDVRSPLRAKVKLFGLRWKMMPTVDEIRQHPQTKQKMLEILSDIGLVQKQDDVTRAVPALDPGFRPELTPEVQKELSTNLERLRQYQEALKKQKAERPTPWDNKSGDCLDCPPKE